jgi:hypothetical protein
VEGRPTGGDAVKQNALRIKDRIAQALEGEDESEALAVLALMLAWFSCRAGLTKEQVLANVGDAYDSANLPQRKAKAN